MGGEEPSEVETGKVVDRLECMIDKVYHYRDHYFEDHDLDDAVHKASRKVK